MRLCILLSISACTFVPPKQEGPNADAALHDGQQGSDGPNDIDAPDASGTCANGVLDPGELDVDCGGPCSITCANIFPTDNATLAVFELNGDLADTSGNARDATSIGGTFVTTAWGKGLSLSGQAVQGFHWNSFAPLLVHPYTVEIVVTPRTLGQYRKLFGATDTSDNGWYYRSARFDAYPNSSLPTVLTANERHYFAIVSTAANKVDVYVNATKIGATGAGFTAPPASAIFFRDDTFTMRNEALDGVVDGVRISSVARSASEITAIQTRLSAQP